jgi:hypothetical protein
MSGPARWRDWFVARSAVHASFGHDGPDMKITIESTPAVGVAGKIADFL